MKTKRLFLFSILLTANPFMFLFSGRVDARQDTTGGVTYCNPVLARSAPDPTVIRVPDGSFYLYCTEDIRNTPIYHSVDLVHWNYIGTAFTGETRPGFEPEGGIWAPDINYINGKYVLYYSMSVWGCNGTCGVGVAVADAPQGPFTDKGALFRSNTIEVGNSIDQFYFEDNGKKYLFWGSFCGIYAVELEDDGLSLKAGAEKVRVAGRLTDTFDPNGTEGTYIHKRGKYYYCFGSTGTCCEGANSTYRVVAGRSENLFGPYLTKDGQSMFDNHYETVLHGNATFAGPGHNAGIVTDDEGNDWMLYHAYLRDEPKKGRTLCLDKIVWTDDWPSVAGLEPSAESGVPAFKHLRGRTNIDNPVLPRVADAGVMKYNGRYYVGGVSTRGDFYVSKDLRQWEGPFHAVTMDNDWATPYSIGNEQIHANDMHYINGVFHLYWSVNYWGRERNVVHIAHAVAGSPLGPYHEPDKSQWLDNRIDAHLFTDDDGKHYFYMVKFTDGNTIWARPMKDPATFEGDEAQYIFASQPNSWETLDNRVAEGPWVIKYRDRYYMMYNTNHTSTRWGNYALGVAEASSPLGFNHGNKYSHPVVKSNQIDLEENFVDLLAGQNQDTLQHKSFVFDRSRHGNLSLRIRHWGAAKVRLNGTLVYENERANYRHVDLSHFKNILKNGNNSLTVETAGGRRPGFANLALFDMKHRIAGDILYTPGQPNILRGPNGFEWWMIYMANKNGEPRGQYIDRVHFLGRKLTVDGVTAEDTPGYHPAPSQPTYQYLSDNRQTLPPLNQTIPSIPAAHYYFEAGVKASGVADGIIAWQGDDNNLLTITLDASAKTWQYRLVRNGKHETHNFPLSPDFRADVYHTIAVFKNHSVFNVLIDNIPAPQKPVIETGFSSSGLPGICSANRNAEFDGIVYTAGWDEYGDNIRGWEESADAKGLRLKGDRLDNYELNMQVSAGVDGQNSSVYPVYIDKNNFLRVDFDYTGGTVSVSGKKKGATVGNHNVDLSSWQDYYVNNVYSDAMERHFTFDDSVSFDAVLFPQEMDDKYDVFYVENGKTQAVSHLQKTGWEHPSFTRIDFSPVRSNRLAFVRKGVAEDVLLQKIRIRERSKQSYNLRAVKDSGIVRVFVDNKPVCDVAAEFEASRTGWLSGKADYITLFHIKR